MNISGGSDSCSGGGDQIMIIKSWFVLAGLIARAIENSKPSFWVGKYEDIKDYPVVAHQWVDGGEDIDEDCVIADDTDNFKLKRVSCTSTAAYFCEPQPPDCPEGYHFIASIGASSCFKLSGFAMETQLNNENISSVLTANKICLEDGTRWAFIYNTLISNVFPKADRTSNYCRQRCSSNICKQSRSDTVW